MSETRISKQVHFTERVLEGCPDRVQECPLCGTESKHQYMGTPPSIEHVNLSHYGCGSCDEMDGISQSPGCKRIADLAQRAEQVERERDTVVESQTFILKSVEEIAAARAAAEAEVKRLREGIESTIRYVLTGVHCRYVDHQYNDCCDCGNITGEFEKLLAQPSDGKEATDAQ